MPFAEGKEEHGHVPLRLYVRSTCWSESARERQEDQNQKQKKIYSTKNATPARHTTRGHTTQQSCALSFSFRFCLQL